MFGVQRPAITKHLSNIFKSEELDEKVVCSILEHTTQHGAMAGKKQTKQTKLYNLDTIISVGYRVNSKRATKFRQWASKVLKEYIIKGYALNKEKLQQQKLQELEQTIALIKQGLNNQELSMQEAKGFVEIIGAYLFVLFLHKNGVLHKANGEPKINDNTLASIALLVATSAPEQKEIIIKLVMNMLVEEL